MQSQALQTPTTPQHDEMTSLRVYEAVAARMPTIPMDEDAATIWRQRLSEEASAILNVISETLPTKDEQAASANTPESNVRPLPLPDGALVQMHPFADYADNILVQPVRGKRHLRWAVGVDSTGQLVHDSWQGGPRPHLVIAGGFGIGGVVRSFLCQMLHNNHPSDVQIWLADMRGSFAGYKHLPHVAQYLGPHTMFQMSAYEGAALMLEEARQTIKQRLEAMSEAFQDSHDAPQTFRELLRRFQESPTPNTAALFEWPDIFVVLPEISEFATRPVAKKDLPHHRRVLECLSSITRQGPAAGVHLLCASHYPNKENLPNEIKSQSRRIGLAVPTVVASLMIIDKPDLAHLKLNGQGIYQPTHDESTVMRALWLPSNASKQPQFSTAADIIERLSVAFPASSD